MVNPGLCVDILVQFYMVLFEVFMKSRIEDNQQSIARQYYKDICSLTVNFMMESQQGFVFLQTSEVVKKLQ